MKSSVSFAPVSSCSLDAVTAGFDDPARGLATRTALVGLVLGKPGIDGPSSGQLVNDFHILVKLGVLTHNIQCRFGGELFEKVVETVWECHVVDLSLDLPELFAVIGHVSGTIEWQIPEFFAKTTPSDVRGDFELPTKDLLEFRPRKLNFVVSDETVAMKVSSSVFQEERNHIDFAVLSDVFKLKEPFSLIEPRNHILSISTTKRTELDARDASAAG
jgi:hypothetical protein